MKSFTLNTLSRVLIALAIAVVVVGIGLGLLARTSTNMGWLAVSNSFNTVGIPALLLTAVAYFVVNAVQSRRT